MDCDKVRVVVIFQLFKSPVTDDVTKYRGVGNR